MGAIERLKRWINQKIAKILGDFQEQEPVEHPSPTRAGCRIFFMVGLLLGFSLLLVYNFIDAPDARVVQMHHLTPGGKNHAFPSCFLYDRNSTNSTKWSEAKFPRGTPCFMSVHEHQCPLEKFREVLRTSRKFVGLEYVIHGGIITGFFSRGHSPDDAILLGNENIVKDTKNLTAENFCNLSYLWPYANSTISPGMVEYGAAKVTDVPILLKNCVWMATLLFNGSNTSYEDRTRSTQFLNTPSLLSREGLNTLLAQLARESVLSRRLALDMALPLDVDNEDLRRFYNALAHLLTGLLDRDEMDSRQSYIYGANDLSLTLGSNQVYDKNAIVWYLGDDPGPIFLQPQIDWEAYRQSCFPEYCEAIKPMRRARKLYWALGILGGVATIALTVVTTLLWPCTAMLLLWISKCNAAATGDPERPGKTLLHDPSL